MHSEDAPPALPAVADENLKDDIDGSVEVKEDVLVDATAVPVEPPEVSYRDEKKLLRKLDLHIIPLAMLVYLLSYLDRINIGNARLYSMEADLDMHGSQFQTAVSVFFVTYVLCAIPSNLVLKKLHPSRYLCFLTISWGLIATFTGLVQSYGSLIACRLLLGVVEAGLFPGMVVYLTCFYTKRDIALRVGYLAVCSALSGMFGGLLALAIGSLDGARGMHGWRWIFIIEGVPTVVLGVVIFFLLPDDFETAYFLSEDDKALMRLRWAHNTGHTTSARSLHKPDVVRGFTDWRIWVFASGQFASDLALYSYATFLPTIIKGISAQFTAAQVQAFTVPCYLLGVASFLIIAFFSDRQQRRGVYAAVFSLIAAFGYALLSVHSLSVGAHYAGCLIVALGVFVCNLMPLAWLPTNCPRYGKRAVANGMQITVGNIGGVASPFIYPSNDAPNYLVGQATCVGAMLYCAIVYALMSYSYVRQNERRSAGLEDHKIQGLSEEEIEELGDDSPRFQYTI